MMENSKDPELKKVIHNLRRDLNDIVFEIVDYWDGDNCATGIVKKGDRTKLVYISTYNMNPDYFYCEFEVGDIDFEDRCETIKEFEDIHYLEMLDSIKSFLMGRSHNE